MFENIKFFTVVSFFVIALSGQSYAQDKFAEIGTRQYQTRENLLETPKPPVLPKKYLSGTNRKDAAFEKKDPISTSNELYAELDKIREAYIPFMKDVAPSMNEMRIRIPLDEMGWRLETEKDRSDFISTLQGNGEWEKVSIPHYGAPLGRAVTYYFKKVNIKKELLDNESLFVCFKGVDYKAEVFFTGVIVVHTKDFLPLSNLIFPN